ncbi:MAG: DUF2911 domain-containing protein [Chitinophagaceae bacterium]|nr:DUF2911 domain-containing protein [Chitinophagaceae bacterium]MBN8668054.1 DUF2911 domain-containing protein [Chitinophagales bacterium]
MKKLLLAAGLLLTVGLSAQLTTPPSGGNKRAMVGEQIGLTQVNIHYDRPGVKGREGQIYGTGIVHSGFIDQQFGPSKSAPWRAGANENTTIEFSTDVTIEGKQLPAGKYGLFVAYDPNACTVIFSKNSISWGSYFYNPEEDALRVTVKPVALDRSVEWLKYEFTNQTDNSATIALQWEKLSIPFKVETDLVKNQLTIFRNELRNRLGFTWQSWNQAAAWCAQRKTNLDEALLWADTATSAIFGGNMVFQTHVTKANVLKAMGRNEEADAVLKSAMPLGSVIDLHQYGRQLLAQKKTTEALEIFKMNYAKNPDQFTTLVGLARGYSGVGDFKNALKYMTKALPLAPDDQNKKSVGDMIDKLKNKQDVN